MAMTANGVEMGWTLSQVENVLGTPARALQSYAPVYEWITEEGVLMVRFSLKDRGVEAIFGSACTINVNGVLFGKGSRLSEVQHLLDSSTDEQRHRPFHELPTVTCNLNDPSVDKRIYPPGSLSHEWKFQNMRLSAASLNDEVMSVYLERFPDHNPNSNDVITYRCLHP